MANGDTGLLVDDINPPNPVPTSGNVIQGNLLVGGKSPYLLLTPKYGWTNKANPHFATAAAAGLGSDWCIPATSPAVDAAPDSSSLGVTGDYAGAPRPLGAGWDVGARECH